MVRLNKILLFLSLGIFLISFVSANGLQVISNQTINVNKSINQDITIQLRIMNQEPFSFVNLSFEDNPYISFSNPGSLASGENRTFDAVISTNEQISQRFNIKGFYHANLGQSNASHDLDVDYGEGVSNCDLSIIEGDSVTWNNLINTSTGTIKMINADTGIEITTISPGQQYTEQFVAPLELNYYFTRYGFDFTGNCRIAVLDDEGIINNPNLDTYIDLNVIVDYPPTTLEGNFLTTNYNMTVFQEKEDIFSVVNTGSEIARNILVQGQWFEFSVNNFDLNPGESRNIGYTLSPEIFSTNDTNKTYDINVTVTGNFEPVSKIFNVFIQYAEVNEGEIGGGDTFDERLKEICAVNPNYWMCPKTKIIYKTRNDTCNQYSVDDILGLLFTTIENQEGSSNYIKERLLDILNAEERIANSTNKSAKDYNRILEEVEEGKGANIVIALTVILSIGAVVLFLLITKKRESEIIKENSKW